MALETERNRLEPKRTVCVELRARVAAEVAAASGAAKDRIRADNAGQLDLCDQLASALSAYDSFVADFGAAGGEKLVAVMRQRELRDRLTASGVLLVIDVLDTSGGTFTQTNLLSALGGMPFHVTAGSVIGWRLVDQSGAVLAADMITAYEGYRQVEAVDVLVNGCASLQARRQLGERQARTNPAVYRDRQEPSRRPTA